MISSEKREYAEVYASSRIIENNIANTNFSIPYPKENNQQLIEQVKDGKYRPNPVRRVEIPKEEKGKVRKLGIPTVVDMDLEKYFDLSY